MSMFPVAPIPSRLRLATLPSEGRASENQSGKSSGLVYGRKILVTRHTSPGIPSRPIPHTLVLLSKPPVDAEAKPLMDIGTGPILLAKHPEAIRPKGRASA